MDEKGNNRNGITKQNVITVKSGKDKKKKLKNYCVMAICIAVVLLIVIGIISANVSRNYYLKDIKILECSVIQSEQDYDKYYIRVTPEKADNFSISEDNSWVEVNSDFYSKHMFSDSKIGVKFVNLDSFTKKYWGLFGDSGQTFEKNVWNIEEVYESKDEANRANPISKATSKANIQKKKITQRGDHFFVIASDQKSMPVMVEEETYNKYNVSDSINCEFESIGELTRFIKIVQ